MRGFPPTWIGFAWLAMTIGLGAAPASPHSAEVHRDAAAMVSVPDGYHLSPFQSGGRRTESRVPPFLLDVRPVTAAEFHLFIRNNPRWSRSRVKRLFADSTYLSQWGPGDRPPAGGAVSPVTQVSWYAAKAYCSDLGKRLPSTAEWERAALQAPEGMDSTDYSARVLEWYGRPAGIVRTASEKSGSRNAFGVRDLFGEVWEWTSDFNNAGPGGRGENSAKDASFFCGGAAGAAVSGTEYATFMRYAFRSSLLPAFTLKSLGFRCARDHK